MRSPRSLRSRLVLVTLVLTLLGLTVAGVATYGALRSFLLDRTDAQLRAASDQVRRLNTRQFAAIVAGADVVTPGGLAGSGGPHGGPRSPAGFPRSELALYTTTGSLIGSDDVMPETIDPAKGTRTIQIGGVSHRVLVTPVEIMPSWPEDTTTIPTSVVAAVALPLDGVHDTLRRLLLIEILVGIAALVAAGGVGYALVRVGLKPLTDIEGTAEAIAEGDLSHRVADENPSTEVGRLGRSLNVMLGQIEASFAEREASERRLRQFVADASHELQTPLTSVRGYAELFRRGAADRPEDLATAMRRIEAESERMGVLVDDLLLLARLDQGRQLDHAPVDLVQVVRDQSGDLRVVAPDHPVTVDAPMPVEVMGDEVRLRQIVTNLLSNARMHTPPGTRVRVSVLREGDEAVIVVADDGPGIDPEHRDRLFERFFRADPSRARASGGSGLGLSIVAAIAASHGGTVSVANPVTGGTTFTVRIPVSGVPPDPVPVEHSPETPR